MSSVMDEKAMEESLKDKMYTRFMSRLTKAPVHIGLFFKEDPSEENILHITFLKGMMTPEHVEKLYNLMPYISTNISSIIDGKGIQFSVDPKLTLPWLIPDKGIVFVCHMWLLGFLKDNDIVLDCPMPNWLETQKDDPKYADKYAEAKNAYEMHKNVFAGKRFKTTCHATKTAVHDQAPDAPLYSEGLTLFCGDDKGTCKQNDWATFLYRFKKPKKSEESEGEETKTN